MMSESEKACFEMGYRQACLDNNVPYVHVRRQEKGRMVTVQVAVTDTLLRMCGVDCEELIASKVIEKLKDVKS